MSKVHIFTSGKNGTGKTVFSLSTLLYYVKNKKRVLFINFNFVDLSIMDMFCRISLNNSIYTEEKIQILRINTYLYIAYPEKGYTIPANIIDLYRYVSLTSRQLIETKSFTPEVIIIDTNLNLANFRIDCTDILIEIKDTFACFFETYTPFYWHIWPLSEFNNVQRLETNNSLMIIAKVLNEFKTLWGGGFNEKINLINIFNIYTPIFSSPMETSIRNKLFFWNTENEFEGTKINEIAAIRKKESSSEGISLEQIQKIFYKYNEILKQDNHQFFTKKQEMYQKFGEALMDVCQCEFNGEVPINIILIDTYYRRLIGFADLQVNRITTFEEIEINLRPLQSIIHNYCSMIIKD